MPRSASRKKEVDDTSSQPGIETESLVTEAEPEVEVPVHPSTMSEALNEVAEPATVPSLSASEPPFPLADPGEYYVGLWSGLPNYGCPYCHYATLEGSGAVELHILTKIDQGNPRHLKALELKENRT